MTDTIPATVKTHTALPYLRDGALVYALCEDGQVNRISIRIDGGFVVLGLSTSKMTVAEMSELQTLMEAFGAQQGVKFSAQIDPDTGEIL